MIEKYLHTLPTIVTRQNIPSRYLLQFLMFNYMKIKVNHICLFLSASMSDGSCIYTKGSFSQGAWISLCDDVSTLEVML